MSRRPEKKSHDERLKALEVFADEMTAWCRRHAPGEDSPVLPLHFHCTCGYSPCVCDFEHRYARRRE